MRPPPMYPEDRLAYAVWGALIWILGLLPMLGTVVQPRKLGSQSYLEALASISASQGGLVRWVGLGSTILFFGLASTSLVLGLVLQNGRLPQAGFWLWLGAMALALGPLVSSQFGARPSFFPALMCLPVAFTAVYLLPPVSLSWFVCHVKRVLLLYAYGSLLAIAIAPEWTVEFGYSVGVIPGFDIRLHGLATHANNLAPLLLTYLVLSWFPPSRLRWERLHQVVVFSALLLTQSKTAWVLLAMVYLIRLLYKVWRLPGLQRYVILALAGAVFAGGTLYLAVDLLSSFGFLVNRQSEVLTGRPLIWEYTLRLWEPNPWFGYGPNLWNGQMNEKYLLLIGSPTPHAHNQVIQSLGEAGIVGAAGLLLYVTTLLVYGARCAKVTGGLALSLVSAILLRGLTEPPFSHLYLSNSNFFLSLLTFAFLMLVLRQEKVSNGT